MPIESRAKLRNSVNIGVLDGILYLEMSEGKLTYFLQSSLRTFCGAADSVKFAAIPIRGETVSPHFTLNALQLLLLLYSRLLHPALEIISFGSPARATPKKFVFHCMLERCSLSEAKGSEKRS
jgi:hypothetical protein